MTELADIRPRDLDIVRSILKAALPPDAKVWIFGSRAAWKARRSSDLDLAIDAGRKLTLDELGALSDGFEDSDLPYTVDVIDWATTGEAFQKIIEKNRVRLTGESSRESVGTAE
jgi:type I restriction enzyme S subunit